MRGVKTKVRVGAMDLKIAAVALANSVAVITRNIGDFSKIPGLKAEDWTKD
jgi:tRNA(fMet)-specific endonuclease VapC